MARHRFVNPKTGHNVALPTVSASPEEARAILEQATAEWTSSVLPKLIAWQNAINHMKRVQCSLLWTQHATFNRLETRIPVLGQWMERACTSWRKKYCGLFVVKFQRRLRHDFYPILSSTAEVFLGETPLQIWVVDYLIESIEPEDVVVSPKYL